MKKLYSLVFFFFVLRTTTSFGQTLLIGGLPSPICAGTSISVTIVTDVTFESTNQFTIQVRSEYSSNTYTSLPFTRTGNVLTFQFPGSLLESYTRYMFRLVSTAPALEGSWTSSAYVYVPAEVRLTGVAPAQGNATEPFSLQFEAIGSPPFTVTLSDSTKQTLDSYGGGFSYTGTMPFYASSSGTYRLQSAQNICGVGKSSGQVDLKVNPISVRTVSALPSAVCRGGTLTVAYSKMGPAFNPANKFKVLLTQINQSANPLSYLLDAKEVNGNLQVIVPDSETGQSTNTTAFYVSVISSDPVVSGSSNRILVDVYPRGSAILTTPSATINYGETISLNVSLQGVPPYQISVSDGMTMYEADATYDRSIQIKPKKSGTYQITQFQSGCSTNVITPSSTALMVNPGITVDSLPSRNNPVCEGQTVRIKFSTNATLSSDNRFSIILSQLYNSWTSDPITPRLEAGNVLAFEIPTLPASITSDPRYLSITLQTTSPVMRSAFNWNPNLSVNSKPTYAQFADYSSRLTLENPGVAPFYLNINGGGPYKVIFNDGQRDWEQSWLPWANATATVFKSTTFTLRSVANACGVLDNLNSQAVVTVQRPAPAQIYLAPLAEYACENDSLTAVFEPTGDFLLGNEFRVQVADASYGFGYGWSDLKVVGRGNQNSIRFAVPVAAKVRIVSTNPVAFSNEQSIKVGNKLKATIPTSYYNFQAAKGVPPQTFLVGESITLPINISPEVNGIPYLLTYTDGTRKYTYQGNTTTATQTDLKPTKTTTYQLLGISNVCGPGQVSGESTFRVMPFRISVSLSMSYGDNQTYTYPVCGGGDLTIPFIISGTPPAGTQFTLQIASPKDSLFSDLVSATTSPLTAQIPAIQAAGIYLVRIVVKGTTAQTEPFRVQIHQVPSATLRAPTSVTTLSGGEGFQTTLILTGTAPWTVLFSDNTLRMFYSSPATITFQPTKATTYSIKAVINECGYGTGTGEASVRVKPTLSLQRTSYPTNGLDCLGGTVALSYQSLGDFDAGNQFSVELTDAKGSSLRTLTKLSASSGRVVISLPSDLATGEYQIVLKASSPVASSSSSVNVYLQSAPSLLLSGSTIINAGQTVYLTLRDEKNNALRGDFVTYRLSDGTKGQLAMTGSIPSLVPVSPTQTTTYTIQSIAGGCGTGRVRGSAVVTVNPPGERGVVTGNPDRLNLYLCTGDSLFVPYSTSGSFSATNQFQVQLLDSTGSVLKTLPIRSTASPLRMMIPRDIPAATNYRVRVVASDANTQSSASLYPLEISQDATAAFDSAVVIRQPDQPITLTLRFGGTGPWAYIIQNETGYIFSGAGTTSPWRVKPPVEGIVYSLVGVYTNSCGAGTINAPTTIRVELLTATDPAWSVEVGPNPTRDIVRINLPAIAETATIQLTNLNGQSLLTRRVKSPSTALNLAQFPAGMYLLSVEVNNRRSIYRLVKE